MSSVQTRPGAPLYGGSSSVGLEHWIVNPGIAGSSPVYRPSLVNSNMNSRVTHCICHNRWLNDIVSEARTRGLKTMHEIEETMSVCDACRLCHPYVELRLCQKEENTLASDG